MLLKEELDFFARYIQSEIGIVYSDTNAFQLESRLEQVAKYMGLAGSREVYELAQKGIRDPLKQLLLDVATNNETSFFRDPKVFHAIEKILLERDQANSLGKKVRIWSAASSTGQEALSIVMMILELNQKHNRKIDFEVIATDISERVLKKARTGRYTQLEVQRGLPVQLLVKYFSKDANNEWLASTELLRRIQYRFLNLHQMDQFKENFDFILCRNVLIYQSIDNKKQILGRIAERTNENGVLILGCGESLMGLSDEYSQVMVDQSVTYRKKAALRKAA